MLKATQTSLSAGRAFRQGFLANLFNPKSVLFAAAVLVTVFRAGIGLADSIVIVAIHFLVEIAFYTALAFGMSTQAVARRYMRAKPILTAPPRPCSAPWACEFCLAGSLAGCFCLGQPST